jgi:hypothetical protein
MPPPAGFPCLLWDGLYLRTPLLAERLMPRDRPRLRPVTCPLSFRGPNNAWASPGDRPAKPAPGAYMSLTGPRTSAICASRRLSLPHDRRRRCGRLITSACVPDQWSATGRPPGQREPARRRPPSHQGRCRRAKSGSSGSPLEPPPADRLEVLRSPGRPRPHCDRRTRRTPMRTAGSSTVGCEVATGIEAIDLEGPRQHYDRTRADPDAASRLAPRWTVKLRRWSACGSLAGATLSPLRLRTFRDARVSTSIRSIRGYARRAANRALVGAGRLSLVQWR